MKYHWARVIQSSVAYPCPKPKSDLQTDQIRLLNISQLKVCHCPMVVLFGLGYISVKWWQPENGRLIFRFASMSNRKVNLAIAVLLSRLRRGLNYRMLVRCRDECKKHVFTKTIYHSSVLPSSVFWRVFFPVLTWPTFVVLEKTFAFPCEPTRPILLGYWWGWVKRNLYWFSKILYSSNLYCLSYK